MAVRLSKIAREFNVGLSTIVEFLHSKGIKISSDPNAKLTDEDYALVAKEFSSDSLGNVSTETETQKSEDDFISIKDEVKLESKLKIVDHIDLDHKTSVTETPEITGNTEQASEPEEMPEVQTPASETKEEIPEVKEEPQEPGTPFKLAQPALKDVKVVGTIDLDAINQRTRPPKKSKQEKERDRKELRKSNKPVAT